MQVRNLSITSKLVLIQLLTAVLVLVLCLIGFVFSDVLIYRELKLKSLMGVANIIATTSGSALEFLDNEAGEEIVNDLRYQPDILNGTIYSADEKVFARYDAVRGKTFEMDRSRLEEKNYYTEGKYLIVCADITSGERKIGSVCLRSELDILSELLSQKLKISAGILLLGAALALVIGLMLQKYISSPILDLASFMKRISNTNNYYERIHDNYSDEVGVLSRSFDGMLDQIERRDKILIDRNALLNSILINIGDGVIVVDLEGTIVMTNPSALELLGQDLNGLRAEDVAKKVNLKSITGSEISAVDDPLLKPLKGGVIKDEFQLVSGLFTKRWLMVTGAPLYDNKGSIHGAVAIFTDITRIKSINQELEEKISLRTLELSEANRELTREVEKRRDAEKMLALRADELQRSNEDLQQFAYVASHDLQEPLRMISSFTQLLEKKYKNQMGPEADEYLHFITDGAARMKTLIDDLLAFSRVSSKAKAFADCDMEEVLNTVLINISETVKKSSAKITVRNKLPKIIADKTQMMQVMQNLITNGIKFQPTDRTPEITIDASEEPDHWRFSVTDNGIGINKEFSSKIFIIFQRLHNQKSYPGSGIGLSICKKIVERHGGKIWFESVQGNGTTFLFTISKDLPKE